MALRILVERASANRRVDLLRKLTRRRDDQRARAATWALQQPLENWQHKRGRFTGAGLRGAD